jgi:hypothetical protein
LFCCHKAQRKCLADFDRFRNDFIADFLGPVVDTSSEEFVDGVDDWNNFREGGGMRREIVSCLLENLAECLEKVRCY